MIHPPILLLCGNRFLGLSTAVVYGYYALVLKLDEEDYGGHGALLQEGLFASMTLFLVCPNPRTMPPLDSFNHAKLGIPKQTDPVSSSSKSDMVENFHVNRKYSIKLGTEL